MSTVSELSNSLSAIADGVNALEAGISELKKQLANGAGPVTQEQLDALATQASDIVKDLADASDQQ